MNLLSKRFHPEFGQLHASLNTRYSSAIGLFLMLVMVWVSQAYLPGGLPGAEEMSPSKLPPMVKVAISKALGRESSAYFAQHDSESEAIRLSNDHHALKAKFNAEGLHLNFGQENLELKLIGVGYGQKIQPPEAGESHVDANEIQHRRGDVTEWYVNGPNGLEQGFTLDRPPAQRGEGLLTVALRLSGSLAPRAKVVGSQLEFENTRITYQGLTAWDAKGEALKAEFVLAGDILKIQVDDANAQYPLTIDPTFAQLTQLYASDARANDQFGSSLAMSPDSRTLFVGAEAADVGGAVYIFARPASGWSAATISSSAIKLTPSSGTTGAKFGAAMAISDDGNTLVVGAPGANAGQGAVHVFKKPSSGWAAGNQSALLAKSSLATTAELGTSVDVNSDGSTIVAGAPGVKSAHVFYLSGSAWSGSVTTTTADLTPLAGANALGFGASVSMDSLGATVVVGAPEEAFVGTPPTQFLSATANSPFGPPYTAGAAYVFVKPSGGWASGTETAKLTETRNSETFDFIQGAYGVFGRLGSTVAITHAGDTIFAGAVDFGTVYIFVKPSGGWSTVTQATATLDGNPDSWRSGRFGASIAFDASDNHAVIGADTNNFNMGKAWVYPKPSGGWGTLVSSSLPSGIESISPATSPAGSKFGKAVALGQFVTNGVAVGGPNYNPMTDANIPTYLGSQAGASFVFGGQATAPLEPRNVVATAGPGSANIAWSAPLSDGGADLTQYRVEVSGVSQPPSCTITPPNTSCVISGLSPGTSYSFGVQARNSVNFGNVSSLSNQITPLDPALYPTAPTAVIAAADNQQATVTWTAPTSAGASGATITGYTVTSSPGGQTCSPLSVTATTCVVTGLTNGTPYTFTVVASNSTGASPASSASNSVTPQSVSAAPLTPLAPVAAVASATSATVTVAAPASGDIASSYTITSTPQSLQCTVVGNSGTCTVSSLTTGTAYTFTAKANNSVGSSTDSPPSNSVTPQGINAPPAPSASLSSPSLQNNYSWPATVTVTAPSGGLTPTSYTVTAYNSSSVSSGTCTVNGSSGACIITFSGWPTGAFTFKAVAQNGGLSSAASPPSNSVLVGGPNTPSSITGVAGDASATVTWSSVAWSSGYNVQLATNAAGPYANAAGGCSPANTNGPVSWPNSPGTTCLATGLTNGTTYYFKVAAINNVGVGSYSVASNAVTPQASAALPAISPTTQTLSGNVGTAISSSTALTASHFSGTPTYTISPSLPAGLSLNSSTGVISGTPTATQSATTHTITGTSTTQTATTVVNVTVLASAPGPIIVSVSPNTANTTGGTTVTLVGSNFTGASSLLFGTAAATNIQVVSPNELTATSPAGTGTVDLVLTTSFGTTTSPAVFTYDAPPAAPGTPIAAPGDRKSTVSWPQVFTGGNPQSYLVTASPGGQTCSTTFPGAVFTYASCVVTGLTNGTTYTFTVTAINSLGQATSGPSNAVTPAVLVNGTCGPANGITTLVQPTGMLCGAGTASSVNSVQGSFVWSCAGTGGGTTAQCSAPGGNSQGPTPGSTTFNTDTSSNGCNLQSARLITPPTGGPGSGTVMPYGAVNFRMISCTGSTARVRMTYASIIEGMQFWKYVVNSQVNPPRNGWYQMPSTLVTMSGNTAEFDIVDNGEWDSDPAVGAIADPGGPGYAPNSLPAAPGTPSSVTASPGNQSATIRWTAPNAGGTPVRYTVTANTGQTCESVYPQTSCTIMGLTNGVSYTFTVVAANAGGVNAGSAATTPVTPQPVVPNPIPTLNEWGLLIMSLLMAGLMGWQFRRTSVR